MRYEEERLTAAVQELETFSATISDNDTLADLAVIITGLQTMRPYVSVGLKVCPSDQTLEATHRLHDRGILTQQLWNTLNHVLELARKHLAIPVQQTVPKPCRRVTSRSFGRPISLRTNRMNRLA